jgi:hypothetical protein
MFVAEEVVEIGIGGLAVGVVSCYDSCFISKVGRE